MSPSRAITRLMIFCSGFLGDLGQEIRLHNQYHSHCFKKMKEVDTVEVIRRFHVLELASVTMFHGEVKLLQSLSLQTII